MCFQRNVTLLLGQMELVVVELDTGAEVSSGAMKLAGAPVGWRALCDLGEHLLGGLGEHQLCEATSNHGEQDGSSEHLRLA
jgi:hypothetical protein